MQNQSVVPAIDKVRGVLFATALIVLTIGAIVIVCMYVLTWQRLVFLYPHWAAYGLTSFAILRLISVIGIWLWSRTAVILYLILTLAATAIWFKIGLPAQSIFGIVGAALLIIVVPSKWSRMTWGVDRY